MASSRRPARTRTLLPRALAGVLAWAVIPAIAALMMVAVVAQSGTTVRVLLGRGVAGTFTAEQQLCSQSRNGTSCQWRGRFDGDDGVRRQPVHLEGGPRGWQPGTTARAIWLPDRPASVFHPGDPRPILLILGLSLTAAAVLWTWVVAARCRILGRPTPEWIDQVHGFCGWPPTTRSMNDDAR